MTQKDKLIERFLGSPRDFTWDELVRLMGYFGYSWVCPKGGSHGVFVHEICPMISPAARPHNRKDVPLYQIKQYKQALIDAGHIDPEEEK